MDFILDVIRWIFTIPFVIVGWIIIGVIAGDLARRLTGSKDRSACADFVLGILGAFVGGFVGGIIGVGGGTGLMAVLINLVLATVGAVILIMIKKALAGNLGSQKSKA